jgi:subtilisin family serine protease
MNNLARCIFIVCFFLTFLPSPVGPQPPFDPQTNRSPGSDYVPGELLVKYRAGQLDAKSRQLRSRWAIEKIRTFVNLGAEHVRIPEGLTLEQAMEIYMADPDVEYVEPNYYRYITATFPNDTSFGVQWSLENTGQTVNGSAGSFDADMDAAEAWDITTGTADVVIAVIDTGIDYTHPDLAGSIWVNSGEIPDNGIDDDGNGYVDDSLGWNFADNTPVPSDLDGHGTHVAGILGARSNNGAGIAALCWTVKMMPLKIIDADGVGTVAREVEAIEYAVENGARIINSSVGGSGTPSTIERNAISSAGEAGILFIAAAGNDGTNNDLSPIYPASHALNNIIAVAATDQRDVLAPFSNFGQVSVDVAAPGVNIYSTKPGAAYQYMSGTSMAAPHVAGIAALLWSLEPRLSVTQVKDSILQSVDVIGLLDDKVTSGGRINALNALSLENSVQIAASPVPVSGGGGSGCFIAAAGGFF